MISPMVRELLRPATFVNSVLWLALTASIFVYGLVAQLTAQQSQGAAEPPDALPVALGGVAVLTGVVSLLIPRFLLSEDRLREAMQSEPDPAVLARDPRSGAVDEGRLRKIQSLSSAERRLLQLPGLYFVPFILRLVLNESIAIYGLVLAFLSHSLAPMLPFAAAAIVLNLTCLPRIDPLLERAASLVR